MNIKAVIFDIDGTYYDHITKSVLPSTIQAVKKLQKAGYKVALCSGRPYLTAKQLPVFDDIPWDGFIGGAGIRVHDEQFQMIWENTFTKKQLTHIFEVADAYKISLMASGERTFITRSLNDEEKEICDRIHLTLPQAADTWHGEVIDALSMVTKNAAKYHVFNEIEDIALQASSEYIIDIIKTDTNKAMGISHLMKYWGYDAHDYMAFGDSLNDCEMLKEAVCGVAMGNAMQALLPFADIICGNSDTPAIADTLKKLNLIH